MNLLTPSNTDQIENFVDLFNFNHSVLLLVLN